MSLSVLSLSDSIITDMTWDIRDINRITTLCPSLTVKFLHNTRILYIHRYTSNIDISCYRSVISLTIDVVDIDANLSLLPPCILHLTISWTRLTEDEINKLPSSLISLHLSNKQVITEQIL